jgi:hypothetical protein
VALSMLLGHAPLASASFGAALLATAVLFHWRGRGLGAAVAPGLLAGAVPLLLLLTMKCGAWCSIMGGDCMAYCGRFCAVGGLCAGLVLGAWSRRREEYGAMFLVAGGVIAALTGLLGCFVGGVTGALWMAAGEAFAALPAFALQLRRR